MNRDLVPRTNFFVIFSLIFYFPPFLVFFVSALTVVATFSLISPTVRENNAMQYVAPPQ